VLSSVAQQIKINQAVHSQSDFRKNALNAKLATSKYLGNPLATLNQGDRDMIVSILSASLEKIN
tara:strand:+ start:368 stop:559 length:192 start_codon:yes stop_codon:yes gene_type:complete